MGREIEFFMNYGWIILVMSVAIGALVYFSVLENCTFVQGLECDGFEVYDSAGTVQIKVRNSLGDSIDARGVNIDTNGDGVGDCTALDPDVIGDGQTADWTIEGCTIGTAGDMFKGEFVGSYTKSDGKSVYSLSGTISSRIIS